MAESPQARLPNRKLFGYAFMEMPLAMAATPMALFIAPFYSRDLGLSLAMVGTIMMLARISDVITDPLIGQLSDRTRTRWGRRKPWILAGAPITLLSVWMLFVPIEPVTDLYFGFWLVLLWLGWTFIGIPFYAWGAEISPDYHERTRIASVRMSFGLIGTLTGMLLPLLAGWFLGYGHEIRESLHIIAMTASVFFVLALMAMWMVPEGEPVETRRISLAEGIRVMWRNGPFKRLMAGFTIAALGPAVGGPLYILFVIYVLDGNLPPNVILLVFYTSNLLGVALWNRVAHHVGKRNAWLMGMTVVIIAQPCYLLLGTGDEYELLAVLALLGIGIGSFNAIPAAMKADVVDLDRLRSGEDRTALFFSVWSLANKFVLAVSAGAVLWLLGYFFGFDAKGENGPEQIQALRLVFCLLPMPFYFVAFAVVWKYPITEARHQRLIALLERRTERRTARQARDPSAAAV